jgi:pilus assembly protein CpaB
MTRLRGVIWLVAGVVLALLAGIVAFSALNRVAEQAAVDQGVLEPRLSVVVASRSVPVRSVLTLEDLQVAEIPASTVPVDALNSMDDAIGRLTTTDLVAGEPLLAQRLVDPNVVAGDGRTAVYLVDGQLLLALPAQDLLSRVGVIKPGDFVDIAATLTFPADRGIGAAEGGDDEQSTFFLLQNVPVVGATGRVAPPQNVADGAAAVADDRPDTLLVTVSPQDALALKYAVDAGGTLDILLRPPGVTRPFLADPVDVDYLINRYRIPTGAGR